MNKLRLVKNAIYWLKATNGSGKSTVPHYMLETSEREDDVWYLYSSDPELKKPKIIATVFEKYNMASVGPYVKGKTFGGCDALHKQYITEALEKLKVMPYDVFVEGILPGAGTIGTGKPRNGESYYNILKDYPRETKAYLFIDIEFETVKERIKARTGKSDSDIESLKTVEDKYNACKKHKEVYDKLTDGVKVLSISNNKTKEEFINTFINEF
jgi:thymidylate kinase